MDTFSARRHRPLRGLASSIALFASVAGITGAGMGNAYSQTIASGPDQLIHRICTDLCAELDQQLAVDSAGNAIAVWSELDNGNSKIVTARFNGATGQWGASRTLAADQGRFPKIGFDAQGNAMAIWSVPNGSNGVMRFARNIGGNWTMPADGLTLPLGAALVDMAVSKNGDVFADFGAGNIGRFDAPTRTWLFLPPIAPLIYSTAMRKIAADPQGNLTVAYVFSGGPYFGHQSEVLGASRYLAATQQWSAPAFFRFFVPDTSQCHCRGGTEGSYNSLALAVDVNGSAIVWWEELETTITPIRRIRSVRYLQRTDTWTEKAIPAISNAKVIGDGALAADHFTNVDAVWVQYLGSYARTIATRYSATTGLWETPRVIQSGGFNSREPHIGTDYAGNAIATWSQRTDAGTLSSTSAIHMTTAARYSIATHTWGPAATIQDVSRKAYRSELGVDDAGRGVVMWPQDTTFVVDGIVAKALRADRVVPH